MEIIDRFLNGGFLIKPNIYSDNRGYFFESFNQRIFNSKTGLDISFIQDNQSLSSKGTLRGFHFQAGAHAQSKLIRVLKGRVLDVLVDLRPNSPSFLKHYSIELSSDNFLQCYIPKGFGHAFLALEDDTILSYKVDNYYSKSTDGGIRWDDEIINFPWPSLVKKFSPKDSNLPFVKDVDFNSLWQKL